MKAVEILNELLEEGYKEPEIAAHCGCAKQSINRLKNQVHKSPREKTYLGLLNIWNQHKEGKIKPRRGKRAE